MEQSPLPAPPGRQLLRDPPTTFYHPGWVPLAVLNPSGTHGAGTGGGGGRGGAGTGGYWGHRQVGGPTKGTPLSSQTASHPLNPVPLGINQTRLATKSLNLK